MSSNADLIPRTFGCRGAYFLILAIVFLLPLFINTFAADAYVLSKWVFLGITVPVAFLLLLLGAFRSEPIRIPLTPVNGFAALFLLWAALSILWSASTDNAIAKVAQLGLVYTLVLSIQSVIGGHRRRLLFLLAAFLCSTLLLAVWAVLIDILGAIGRMPFPVRMTLGDWRDFVSTAGLGNTSHIGDALVIGFLGWLATFLLAWKKSIRLISVVALIIHSAGLIVCWSVHSNLSLIVASILLLFLLRHDIAPRMKRIGIRWPAMLIAGWIAVVAFYAVDHPLNPHGSRVWAGESGQTGGIFAQAFSSPRWTAGFETREAIWLTSLEIVRENPWLGVGVSNFTYTYPGTVSELLLNTPRLAPYAGLWTNSAHNEILQTWAELGIIGVFILLALVITALRSLYIRFNRCGSDPIRIILATFFCAIVAITLQSQMNFPLQLPLSIFLFFFLLTLPDMLPARFGEDEELLLPVQRPYGSFVLGVIMKNIAYPTELRGHCRFSNKSFAIAATITSLIIAVPVLQALRIGIADIHYAEARRSQGLGENPAAIASRIDKHDRVLAVWPKHVDCRSGRTELLLKARRFEEVPAETELVLRRLNATEVYARRAVALEKLGQPEAAEADWEEVRRRLPMMEQGYKALYLTD